MMAKENRISNKEKRHNDRDTQVVANENAIKYFKQKGGWRLRGRKCWLLLSHVGLHSSVLQNGVYIEMKRYFFQVIIISPMTPLELNSNTNKLSKIGFFLHCAL